VPWRIGDGERSDCREVGEGKKGYMKKGYKKKGSKCKNGTAEKTVQQKEGDK